MPILSRLLTVLVLSYVGACVALFLVQDFILFYPNEVTDSLYAEYEEFELQVSRSKKISVRGYVVNREESGPVVVFFTGNLGEARTYVERFAAFGVPVVLNNYRGFGKSDGRPREKAMINDAKLLIEWVRSEFPNRQLVLMGNSMGTGVAILAADENVDGLILAAPFRSLVHVGKKTPGRFFPLRLLMRTKLDVRSRLDSLPEKVFVVYSKDDTLIPAEESERVLDRLPQAHVVKARGGHGDLLRHSYTLASIEKWLKTNFAETVNRNP